MDWDKKIDINVWILCTYLWITTRTIKTINEYQMEWIIEFKKWTNEMLYATHIDTSTLEANWKIETKKKKNLNWILIESTTKKKIETDINWFHVIVPLAMAFCSSILFSCKSFIIIFEIWQMGTQCAPWIWTGTCCIIVGGMANKILVAFM